MFADSDDELETDCQQDEVFQHLADLHRQAASLAVVVVSDPRPPLYGPRSRAPTRILSLEDLTQLVPENKFLNHFRFEVQHFHAVKEALQIPEIVKFNNGSLVSGIEATAILLKRLSSHSTNADLGLIFKRPETTISGLCVQLARDIGGKLQALQEFHHRWLSYQKLDSWAKKVCDLEVKLKNGTKIKMPLESVGGFVDGKCIGVCRPCRLQRQFFCMHHAFHVFKSQVVVFPNGMILCWGPFKVEKITKIYSIIQACFILRGLKTIGAVSTDSGWMDC